jgi:hypothetical protein
MAISLSLSYENKTALMRILNELKEMKDEDSSNMHYATCSAYQLGVLHTCSLPYKIKGRLNELINKANFKRDVRLGYQVTASRFLP